MQRKKSKIANKCVFFKDCNGNACHRQHRYGLTNNGIEHGCTTILETNRDRKKSRRQHMKYDIFVQKPNQFETSCTSFP